MQVDELCVPRMSVICQVEDDVKEVDPELAPKPNMLSDLLTGTTDSYVANDQGEPFSRSGVKQSYPQTTLHEPTQRCMTFS